MNQCKFSPCRKYRYSLRHSWVDDNLIPEPEKPIMWIGLNPSTADENQLDPTLRRIRKFSADWGFNCFYMTNLFAYRATEPKDMIAQSDPIGSENDQTLLETSKKCDMVLCCWGNHGGHLGRSAEVLELLKDRNLYYLEMTGADEPKHPLYAKGTIVAKKFK